MERASEGPGKARKVSICRKFDSGLRQRVPFVGKNAFNRVVRAKPGQTWPNSTPSRNGTKLSFLESSPRALQVSANRRVRIAGACAVSRSREAARCDDSRKALVETSVAAARRCGGVQRPTELARGARAMKKHTPR
ncbi:hypothetical protein THAOC_27822 [Thalassiosira oceanica]|uniref:Uncharacterized protein n=1 Tax=Thalassiosira oceanica TaxID=159749 RepID=K0S1S5_THAOC|nr:hypothetical protein THAOC_27822 [Thalassiosira oceanica]|eukprot:EJK52862.1 hypothetical protein THAOC_27822 [Thalassiosira oceanica]